MAKLPLAKNAVVLDAGCGTGGLLQRLREVHTGPFFGFDFSASAIDLLQKRQIAHIFRCSVNDIALAPHSFDLVVCADVLECDGVNVDRACNELWRVVKPGGYLIVVVPAYRCLMNESHHRAVHASRRFSRPQIRKLFSGNAWQIVRISHLFPSFLPLIALWRWSQALIHRSKAPTQSDLRPLPGFLNSFLTGVVDLERHLLNLIDFPFGSSILAILHRPEAMKNE
ncbi:MAG: class I SAM-dependent methyltransferase [Alphaproteobacteria bacterium]|nr:class I SAM-dependent methyltransferase [Alphaproteobacteria bacterium]